MKRVGPGFRKRVILKSGKAWVRSKHGGFERKFAMREGRFTKFVGKHKAKWHKQALERTRERRLKLKLREKAKAKEMRRR